MAISKKLIKGSKKSKKAITKNSRLGKKVERKFKKAEKKIKKATKIAKANQGPGKRAGAARTSAVRKMKAASRKENKLFQSCHILHKQGRYFIVHFKELFMLDGKKSNLEQSDLERRNTIATLLSDWGLIQIQNTEQVKECSSLKQIKIIPFKEKNEWELCPKYNIGNTK